MERIPNERIAHLPLSQQVELQSYVDIINKSKKEDLIDVAVMALHLLKGRCNLYDAALKEGRIAPFEAFQLTMEQQFEMILFKHQLREPDYDVERIGSIIIDLHCEIFVLVSETTKLMMGRMFGESDA